MTPVTPPSSPLGCTLALLLIRIWLGMRAVQSGIEKYAGMEQQTRAVMVDGQPNEQGLTETVMAKAYRMEDYQGVPEALYSKLEAEPLIPNSMLGLYDNLLGPALIVLGLAVLIGFATRVSLFAMGLLYTSLTFGLILIKQDAGIAWLATHIIMVALALVFVEHNRLALSNLRGLSFSKNW